MCCLREKVFVLIKCETPQNLFGTPNLSTKGSLICVITSFIIRARITAKIGKRFISDIFATFQFKILEYSKSKDSYIFQGKC